MMKNCCYFLLLLSVVVGATGCIRSEGPNIEADILSCTFESDILKIDPVIGTNTVMALVVKNTDKSHLAPLFTLSPGATISPASGEPNNFNTPQRYTVTSEDGKWTKTYVISVIDSDIPLSYHFEHWTLEGKYEIPFEEVKPEDTPEPLRMMIWSSGNAGFSLTGMAKTPEEFPTAKSPEGRNGSTAAKLVTRSTGSFGAAANKRIAAGNLFIGTFDASQAMANALAATRFGTPFGSTPLRFKGCYKYKSGEVFQDPQGNPVAGAKDHCTIYAIFYDRAIDGQMLDGSNALTSPKLIATAEVPDLRETDEWIEFDIPFIYLKTIDPVKLDAYHYNIAIICSSSNKGAEFSGAVGSTLIVDDLELVCE